MKYNISVNDQKFEVNINDIEEGIAKVTVNGRPFDILIENYEAVAVGSSSLEPAQLRVAEPATTMPSTPSPSPKPAPTPPRVASPATGRTEARAKPVIPAPAPAPKKMQAAGEIVAPIPGRIMDIKVKVGATVSKGQTVAIMEAMKMENNIVSTMDGMVQEIRVQKDSEVATGEVIMIIG